MDFCVTDECMEVEKRELCLFLLSLLSTCFPSLANQIAKLRHYRVECAGFDIITYRFTFFLCVVCTELHVFSFTTDGNSMES